MSGLESLLANAGEAPILPSFSYDVIPSSSAVMKGSKVDPNILLLLPL